MPFKRVTQEFPHARPSRGSELTKRNILLRLVRAFPYQWMENTLLSGRVGDNRREGPDGPGFLDLRREVETGGGDENVVLR